MTGRRLRRAAISFGANLGCPETTLAEVIRMLQEAGLESVRCSSLYRTKPVGCPPGTPDFMNAAIVGTWAGSPFDLLHVCRACERAFGRPDVRPKNAPRTLDLDLLLVGDLVIRTPELTLPHPAMRERLFVLVPLAEVAPDMKVPPDHVRVDTLLARLLPP